MQVFVFALLLAGTSFAPVQSAPQSQPQQPGMPPPMQQSVDPSAMPAAPPSFAPGVEPSEAPASPRPRFIRISGGVMAGNIVQKTDPVYPDDAKAAHISGTVVMSAHIGRDGRVKDLAVVSGPQVLQAAAVDAVKQWIYRPYLLNGEPVDVSTVVTVNFSPR
jgi:TonB family protein